MVGSNLCVALLIAAIVHTVLSASKRSHAAQAAAVAEGLANIAASNIESELGRVDAVIRATAAEIERLLEAAPAGHPAVQQVLQARLGLLEGVEGLRLADAEGKVRWGNDLPADRLLDVSDRDDFRQLKPATSGAGPWLHIKLTLVLVSLVVSHLRMFRLARLVRTRDSGGTEAELDALAKKALLLGNVTLVLYMAVIFVAIFRFVLFANA